MPAFNLEHEQRRLNEPGITYGAKIKSTKDNLRTLLAERTNAPSFFEMRLHDSSVLSTGYEHRGDLINSFVKSESEAETEKIARRYGLENKGYSQAKDKFINLPLYSTVLLFSPPPEEPIPDYPGHSLAYFYHILPGEIEGVRVIKALAWVNKFTKEDQAEILNNFSEEKKVLPNEESILSSPVSIVEESNEPSFRKIWNRIEKYFTEQKYKGFTCPSAEVMEDYLLNGDKIMKNRFQELDIMIEDLAKRLSSGQGRQEIADDFDTMLKRADKDWLHKDWGIQDAVHMNVPVHSLLREAIVVFALNKNNEQVRQVMTFCGLSGGMSGNESQLNTWSFNIKNDTKKSTEQTKLCCTCPFCNRQVEAEVGGGKISCPQCGKSAPYSKSN